MEISLVSTPMLEQLFKGIYFIMHSLEKKSLRPSNNSHGFKKIKREYY